jgi:hypothetical protein
VAPLLSLEDISENSQPSLLLVVICAPLVSCFEDILQLYSRMLTAVFVQRSLINFIGFIIAGKTQCINHFKVNDSWYLVDLPGYG